MCEYYSDVRKVISKFDLYHCNPGEYPDTNTLGGRRPYVILSSNDINCPISNSFIAAPIRSDSALDVNAENVQECIEQRREKGRIYIPIRIEKDRVSFIDLTQIRQIDVKIIDRYIGTIIQQDIRDQINSSLMELLFGSDEVIYDSRTKIISAPLIVPEKKETASLNEIVEPENKDTTHMTPVNSETEIGQKINAAIEEQSKVNEKKVLELCKQVRRKELSKSTAAKKLGLTIKAFEQMMKEISKEEKESKGPSKYSMRSLPKTLPQGFSLLYNAHKNGKMTVKEMSEKLSKSEQTVYNYIARYKQLQEENKVTLV